MRRHLFPRFVALALGAAVVSGCGLLPKEIDEPPPPLNPPAKSVKEVYTVARGDIAERVQLRALIAPRHEATLMFKQGGRLKQRYVEAGQMVTAGQLLAELETGNLLSQIELAEVNLQRAELRLQQARDKAETFKGGIDPYEEQFLQLDLRAARISLEQLRAQLAEARIHAPFAGLVSDAKGNPGDQFGAYQALITIQDPTSVVIKADVDDATVAKLAAGQRVQVQFTEFGEKPVDGKLVAVPSLSDPAPAPGRSRQVQIELGSPAAGAKLGLIGRAYVILQEKQGTLILSNNAVRSYAGRKYVIVVEGDSKREVDIVTGIVGELETEVLKGLTEGQKVMGR